MRNGVSVHESWLVCHISPCFLSCFLPFIYFMYGVFLYVTPSKNKLLHHPVYVSPAVYLFYFLFGMYVIMFMTVIYFGLHTMKRKTLIYYRQLWSSYFPPFVLSVQFLACSNFKLREQALNPFLLLVQHDSFCSCSLWNIETLLFLEQKCLYNYAVHNVLVRCKP
jgi:hypothetical protein